MPSFKAPQYTKAINPKTGNQEPCYIFQIDYQSSEDGIQFVADNISDITLQNLQKCILENVDWWNIFVEQFLQASSKFFSKKYTVEQINKITQHTLSATTPFEGTVNVCLLPKSINILGGIFTVNWSYVTKQVVIDIPDFEDDNHNIENLPVSTENKVVDHLEEFNIDELPVGTTDEALEIQSPAKFYDKQRVKEYRLKAKLAVYKAQRQMAQYYEKYGNDISDSDTELETSDEDNSDEEEVQL
jgi:hypothetical protein